MPHYRVQFGIVLDARQVAIMLNPHEWVVFEHLGRECIAVRPQGLSLEGRGVPLEQLFDEAYDCGLACPGLAVEDQELLDFTSFSSQNRPDRPLELLALFRQI